MIGSVSSTMRREDNLFTNLVFGGRTDDDGARAADASTLTAGASPAPRPLPRAYTPRSVHTLMDDSRLHDYGLRIFEHESRSWLMPMDADTLVDDRPSAAWLPGLTARIDELRALAAEEGVPFSDESALAAVVFARELNATKRPGAFLVGNGNVRLLWTDEPEQIGLQFRDARVVQFVMLGRRGPLLASHMGEDDAEGVLRHVTAAGLRHLFAAR